MLLALLTVLFVGLKLCNQITWSWWLVLSPLYLYLSLFLLGIVAIFLKAMQND